MNKKALIGVIIAIIVIGGVGTAYALVQRSNAKKSDDAAMKKAADDAAMKKADDAAAMKAADAMKAHDTTNATGDAMTRDQ